ncbi:MAG TPA: Imm52 family immunity protein [Stellaceae bacterium]|nr:Imm52 family immunity protein [Stellaceae bacterium]
MTDAEDSRFWLTAYWGPRRESPTDLARRFVRTLESLKPINPVFRTWYFVHRDEGVALQNLDRQAVAALIAEHVWRADDGDPIPKKGYIFTALNGDEDKPRHMTVILHAGNTTSGDYFINTASLYTEPLSDENADLFTADIFKPALLAIASAWDATWCGVRSSEMNALETPTPSIVLPGPIILPPRQPTKFRLAWMSYLSPSFAPLVTPPRSALVTRTAEGALLMIATEERFSVANSQHMKVARDIEAALAPVNALPWPPDALPEGPSGRH